MNLFTLLAICSCLGGTYAQFATAVCHVRPNPSIAKEDPIWQDVRGTVTFKQWQADGPVVVKVNVTGFDTTDDQPKHGFHVHDFGDIVTGCEAAGGHFNPFKQPHGGRLNATRHLGDLGNLVEDPATGSSYTQFTDPHLTFCGDGNIAGRTIDIHYTYDDLGAGGSLTIGNSGRRLACCVIGMTSQMTEVGECSKALGGPPSQRPPNRVQPPRFNGAPVPVVSSVMMVMMAALSSLRF